MDVLRATMRELNSKIECHEETNSAFRKDIQGQVADVKSDLHQQTVALTAQFEQSLEKAMRRQDTQFERSFAELRSIMLSKPVPAKKAKSAPPPGETPSADAQMNQNGDADPSL